MMTVTLRGFVRAEESGTPLPGLLVKAYDKDLLFDDLLGSAITSDNGYFNIVCEARDFRDLFQKRPDLYFRIYHPGEPKAVYSTEDAVRWNVGVYRRRHPCSLDARFPPARTVITMSGDDGEPADTLQAGESLAIAVTGLRPLTSYDFHLYEANRELLTNRLLTGRRGEIETTVLWPQIALEDPAAGGRLTFEEARTRWQGRTLDLAMLSGKEGIARAGSRPRQRALPASRDPERPVRSQTAVRL